MYECDRHTHRDRMMTKTALA